MHDRVSAETIERATDGDPSARETLVRAIRDDIFNLATRFFGHPSDAQEATQAIVMRVLEKLSDFGRESSLENWVYQVAVHYLLNAKRSALESERPTFESWWKQLDLRLLASAHEDPNTDRALAREVKILCTQGMLRCLDRDARLAYLLGVILELPAEQASAILDLTHDAFQKRVSGARTRLTHFMRARCGLVKPDNRCRCAKQVGIMVRHGMIDRRAPLFSSLPTRGESTELDERIDKVRTAAEVFRSHPDYAAPQALVERLRRAVVDSVL